MSVFRAIIISSFVAGIAAGSAVTVAQQVGTVPMILQGEVYEAAGAAASDRVAAGESTEGGATQANEQAGEHSPGPEHQEIVWKPKEGWERIGLTGVANILTSIGFALLLGVSTPFVIRS